GTNFEYWSNNQDSNVPSPKRRRVHSPDGENDRKKSPNNNSGLDSIVSPHASGGIREGSPNFEISNGKSDIKVTVMESVTSVSELIKCCPPTWAGGLILKSSGFALRMYFCSGDIQLVDLMKETTASDNQQAQPQPTLRITQRLRLESTKLEEVSKRISSSSNSGNNSSGHCILIASQASNLQLNFNSCSGAVASGSGGEDNAGGNASAIIQQRPIRNLVTYLKSKDAAGVVILPGKSSTQSSSLSTIATPTATSSSSSTTTPGGEQQTNETSKNVLYLFPPHPFSLELIQRIAPNISESSASKEDYFVVVLVRGGQ
ncbi:hypothetical protein BLA29_005708, partial [Euroglyphus maynei]